MAKKPDIAISDYEVPPKGVWAQYGFFRPHDRMATAYTGKLPDLDGNLTVVPEPRTRQEFKDECDINNVIKHYKQTGQITHIAARAQQGTYTDLPDPVDFQDAINLVMEAENAFASLPAKVRDRFGNDPERFLDFMSKPENQDEMISLGLAKDTRPLKPPPSTPEPSASTPPPPKTDNSSPEK